MVSVVVNPVRVLGAVPVWRGVYLGDSPEPFVEEDVARLKQEVGVTCIRYGMEPRALVAEELSGLREEGFQQVREVLDWCAIYGVHCILDLHNAPGRLYGGDPRLWRESAYQDRFVGLWRELVARFRDHPAVAAYELLNEPEPPDGDFGVWNRLAQRTAEAVRGLDEDRPIIVDSIGYARPEAFAGLELSGVSGALYSFHNYQPGPYHCQKRRELSDQSTYAYPGFIPHKRPAGDPKDFSLAHFEPTEARFWNRAELVEEFQEPLRFRERHGVPLFCGEFGCVSDVPPMTDMVYLMDEISILQERGIGWTLYNTMYRTNDPYWRDHFDCGLYIWYSPEQRLYRFRRKIALMRFFCANEGEVLDLPQPEDAWVGLYGLRDPGGTLKLLVANKHRQDSREVELQVRDQPERWTCWYSRMSEGDEGFVPRGPLALEQGRARLDLPPLTLALLEVPPAVVRG
ncbi:MAG TPA: cellulase family glycosylhydrolase [Armatimonadota bacterium]|jgi:endoglucanase